MPVPTPTACGAPHAAANSFSNASSSGPSTNQPRVDDAIDRARGRPRASAPGTQIEERDHAVLQVVGQVRAVEGDRPLEPFAQARRAASIPVAAVNFDESE